MSKKLFLNNSKKNFITNLLANYRYEDDFTDETGNYDATISGSVTFGTGKIGKSAVFNGAGGYLYVPSDSNWNFTTGTGVDVAFSGCCWVKFNSFNNYNPIINKRLESSKGEWQVHYVNTGTKKINFQCANPVFTNQIRIDYDTTLSTGVWYHIGWTYTASKLASGLKLYLNGVSVGTTSTVGSYSGMTADNANTYFGFNDGIGSNATDLIGELDEVHIWRGRVITPSEMALIYAYENSGIRP